MEIKLLASGLEIKFMDKPRFNIAMESNLSTSIDT